MASLAAFADSGKLLARITHAVRNGDPVTFLFGSALTAPGSGPEDIGVPGAGALVNTVLESFRNTDEFEALNSTLAHSNDTDRYQDAMRYVIDCRGQDALNQLIRTAVLKARVTAPTRDHSDEQLEFDASGWHLRPAVEAVGRLVTEYPHIFSAPLLTTNFDPLLEISIRRATGNAASIFLPADGQFTNILAPDTFRVVHLHGFWRGGDTLHTPSQLTRNRPQLKGSLRSILRHTTLVVIGYGGWSDVFTRTLVDVISEQTDELNVLWTFYSDSAEDIVRRNQVVLERFDALAGQRVVFYKGIDCHVFLPTLRAKLHQPLLSAPIAIAVASRKDIEPFPAAPESSDHPPQSAFWVGREDQLRRMLSSKSRVMAITGLGGNGKSALAAKYIELKKSAADISEFYWADCREQRDTLLTQLVRMVERISKGSISGADLQRSTPDDIVELFLNTLTSSSTLVVFDNIDQYVEVEQCKAIGIMNVLLEKALSHPTVRAQFIFTGRPRLEYVSPDFLQIELGGLTLDDTQHLLEISGVRIEPAKQTTTILELHSLTQGHSLALNLIATQVSKNKANLDDLLVKLKTGLEAGLEHPIFPQIWASLNLKQQTILRYLAEQTNPAAEQRIASYLGNAITYNQFSKAIKSLKTLNLVVVKSPGGDDPDTLELHPLISDFIRRNFKLEERAPFIDSIIRFCDLMIGQFRSVILHVPFSALENWTSKVELSLRRGLYVQALEALNEIREPLEARGYPEELIRLSIEVLGQLPFDENEKYTRQHDLVFRDLVKSLSHLGRYGEADKWLSQFGKTITGKTARFVLLCEMQAYRYWFAGEFGRAIEWAQQGVDLKKAGNLDTTNDCGYNLALAQRDDGRPAEALKFFLGGESLDVVLGGAHFDKARGGHFYGNIGRCLQLEGKGKDALVCIKKSALLLEEATGTMILLNRGYAAFWIGEILEASGDNRGAYVAFRRAAVKWKTPSPPSARKATAAAERVRERLTLGTAVPVEDWECERAFLSWLSTAPPPK